MKKQPEKTVWKALFTIATTSMALWTLTYGKKLLQKNEVILGYDFEKTTDMTNIEYGKQYTRLDNTIHKHGENSLLWKWSVSNVLQFSLKEQLNNYNARRSICGVHFWIYQKKPILTYAKITFINKKYKKEFSFRISLNFQNWRAVARTFTGTELERIGSTSISFLIESYDPYNQNGYVNLDLIRISNICGGWTYDFVNSPQLILPFGKENEISGIEDLNGIYDQTDYWQGLYKWRKVDLYYNRKIDKTTPINDREHLLLKEISIIENRVDNWVFPEIDNFNTLDPVSLLKLDSLRNCELNGIDKKSKKIRKLIHNLKFGNFAHTRQKAFKIGMSNTSDVCVYNGYKKYFNLTNAITGKWPSLFPSRDILPYAHKNMTGLKFHQVTHEILLPLSLEYFISKRIKQRLLFKQTEKHPTLDEILSKELQYEVEEFKSIDKKSLRNIYQSIDNRRFNRLIEIFNHLVSEGWDDGSGLGNSDHLLNVNGGFTQSLYLLRKDLKRHEIFKKLINAARWYNEIGETQLTSYPHKGTTADKIKGAMFGRLYTVLASPSDTIEDIRQKIHDMKNLKRWAENALEINEGYGGLIKPDFMGYHHKGPFMSEYVPNALQALSLFSYFFHDTQFAISKKVLQNLKKAIKTYYVISNNYEIPVGISGSKISSTTSKAMSEVVPAFAYLSLSYGDDNFGFHTELTRIFLKLYQTDELLLRKYLLEGKPYAPSQYLNTIGSITIFERLKQMALQKNVQPATSPHGSWNFPYAALSIHRRKNWTVSIKGFSKYVWDYESLVDQNNYGRYQSHGHLQIVTDDTARLEVYDYFSGWDWNRIPGTTTVELELSELISLDKSRYFTKSTMVGGLTYKNRHGIFVMDFIQPMYGQPLQPVTEKPIFLFKKSYFLYDNLIVCLGSNIQKIGLENRKVITTLFQNKIRAQEAIYMNNETFKRGTPGINKTIVLNQAITFIDINNNGYFIPSSNSQKINVLVSKTLDPRKPNGLSIPADFVKWYASVTIDHGFEPMNDQYEYAILVNSALKELEKFKQLMTSQNNMKKPYRVLRKDDVAHIVKFERNSMSHTGYTIFNSDQFIGDREKHFLRKVNQSCVVMVKETKRFATLAIMNPDLKLFDEPIDSSKDIPEHLLYHANIQPSTIEVTLNGNIKLLSKFKNGKTENIYVHQNEFGDVNKIINISLSHGQTVEVGFRKLN